ncbi:unnamed protein product [Cylicocyclus nassatus]|uniref:Uncharacterized protein n=1 Tax=Cylicocyclus nassatus TaxID=53992 RepID=A0AA36MC62_CYLNA|nr:unnamed protein product [Cylicocyclus nassatus]
MSEEVTVKDDVDIVTPFLIFLAVGFFFGIILCYLHIRMVKSMVAERLSHIPKAKKVKVKKKKKKKKRR